jgi:hypothetical protein
MRIPGCHNDARNLTGGGLVNASKVLGKALQFGIADSQRVELFHGRKHIISARSGTAMALARVMKLVG